MPPNRALRRMEGDAEENNHFLGATALQASVLV